MWYSPRKDMEPVEVLWDMEPVEVLWDGDGGTPQKVHGTGGSIMGWRWGTRPPPGINRQTPVKT